MASGNQIIWAQSQPGEYRYTVPSGFQGNIEIYCWGAGGAQGRGGSRGGAGGFASTITTVEEGDEIVISVGGPAGGSMTELTSITAIVGYSAGAGYGVTSLNPTTFALVPITQTVLVPYSAKAGRSGGTGLNDSRFAGGLGGNGLDEDSDSGWAGGGGGASAVLINSAVVCVGAGGGGGSGYGEDGGGAPGNPGLAGGVYVGLAATTVGASPGDAGSPGGAGGGGYLGGAATPGYGDDYYGAAPGGNGGQNYGDITQAGSGIDPGGLNSAYYPRTAGNKPARIVAGEAQSGYVVLILSPAVSLKYKEAGSWKNVPAIFYKASNEDRSLTRTYTRRWTTTGSDTFTVPGGVSAITATVLGGGGGGGGSHSGCENGAHHGGTGGGGQNVTQTIAVSEGQVLTVTVGSGGAGGGAQSRGADGGNSVFGTVVAKGGGGGAGAAGKYTGAAGTNYGGGNGGSAPWASGGSGNPGTKGSVQISYVRTFRVTGWKRVLRIWHKVNGIWKEVRSVAADTFRIDRY